KKILISEILYPFQFKWCFLSTGLFSLLYALKKYGEEYDYILCGISFKGGKHFYDNKSMTSRRGKVDYSFIKSWKTISNYQIFTMDEISLDQIVPLKIEE